MSSGLDLEDFELFCDLHGAQLLSSNVPRSLWPGICAKVQRQTFDGGEYFAMLRDEDNNSWKVVVTTQKISHLDTNSVFLIDHCWTYRLEEARKCLLAIPGLAERLGEMMEIPKDLSKAQLVDQLLKDMWRFNQTYSLRVPQSSAEDKLPFWYLMDEFGSRVAHSSQPNARVVPFYYIPEAIGFSLLFLLEDLVEGDEVTRDYAEVSLTHKAEWRDFHLLPWIDHDFSALDYNFRLPDDQFFQTHKVAERMPTETDWKCPQVSGVLKVYSEYEKVNENLRSSQFQLVADRESADVLWVRGHFTDFQNLYEKTISTSRLVFVNQFPYESILTVKDMFAGAVHCFFSRSSFDSSMQCQPKWLAVSYSLETELPQFVSHFQNRVKLGLDNIWIVKPWNLARGLDMTVTDDLACIIRLRDSGPKLACRYIHNPVLYQRENVGLVKFDMRFIVMLNSVKPLKVVIYNNFWLRFAAKPFSLDHFDDYEKHFTVMNYTDPAKIKQMFCKDFVVEFCRQYPEIKWSTVESAIYSAIKEAFVVATANSPPKGLAHFPLSRAMYGVDVMLQWDKDAKGVPVMQPVILEVNFTPDCERACNYYPDFMDVIFHSMFLDQHESLSVTVL